MTVSNFAASESLDRGSRDVIGGSITSQTKFLSVLSQIVCSDIASQSNE